ncbi:MAG: immune inhibitor A [Pontiellaceae bacterium]|nr:immune inhibitor A [Pontiellaceae bacterium]
MKKIIAGLLLYAALGAQAAPFPGRQSEPNPEKLRELRARRELIAHPETEGRLSRQALSIEAEEKGRVLVLLVEFGGTNTFTWTPGESLWDPFGYIDRGEWNGTNHSDAAASQFFADYYGITGPTNMVYSGPLHNEIPRPPSGDMEDSQWNSIWHPDFSADYYSDIIFGDGVVFDFERGDGSHYYADWSGYSVSNYYAEMSGGKFSLEGDVYGWITLTNSLMYYAADAVPGALSVGGEVYSQVSYDGGIPGASDSSGLVMDACRAAVAQYPEIDWADYDLDGDGIVDSLWIIFAGFSEEEGKSYDDTDRPESRMWSHSFDVSPIFEVVEGIQVEPYIMMPESSGPSVLAHEYGHALGAIDLYSYSIGDSSAESWTQMGYTWVGFPASYLPLAMDPYHLDSWGWLDPLSITNPPEEPLVVELYQAGNGVNVPAGMERSVRIRLEDQEFVLPVQPPVGSVSCWWGGQDSYAYAVCSNRVGVAVEGSDATLSLQIAYDVEQDFDYVVVGVRTQESEGNWSEPEWLINDQTVPAVNGLIDLPLPFDGLTGKNEAYPDYSTETFDLGAYKGRTVRFEVIYVTDGGVQNAGPYLGEVTVFPGADSSALRWSADAPGDMESDWSTEVGTHSFPQYYYLQWRNAEADGGYDQVLGFPSNAVGPATSGLLAWYVNEAYSENEVDSHLVDAPSYGAKGVALVADAHPGVFAKRNSFGGRPSTNALVMYDNLRLSHDAAFGLRDTLALPDGTNGVQAGRALFTDSRNYGAGAAYTYLDPRSVPPQFEWSAWSYDGSVVTPSRKEYPLRAPGMPAGTEVHRVWSDGGYYSHASEPVSPAGGTGNPLDVGGEYGWNVEVVEDHGTSAVVRIWNSHYCPPYPVLVDCFGEGSMWPVDDFLAWPESNAVVQVEASPYHHITQLLYNGAEISEAVGLQDYALDLGAVSSNSSVYAFFSADRVAGSTIPKKWFVDQGIPLLDDALSADFDGDGLSNAAEYAAGTRANDASSGLALSVVPTASGMDLSWAGQWNHWYEVDVSTNLLTDPFRRMEGPLPGEYNGMEYTLPNSDGESGFYRIRVVPAPE